MTADLYRDLGIPRSASHEEVKQAHRRKVKETHPDKPGGSREKFGKIQRAYMVLSDAHKRQNYDATGDSEDRPDNNEAQARQIVANLMAQALEQSERLIFREDIFAGFISQTIKPSIQKIAADKEKWVRNIARNEKFLAKVKRKKKPGLDLVRQIIDGMTAEFHRNMARADEAIAIHQRAIEIVAEYEYEFEKQQEVRINVHGFSATSATASNW